MIQVVSFDLDNTLSDMATFDDLFWFEKVPKLYAQQYNISFKRAQEEIAKTSFYSSSSSDPEWYRPKYWFKLFNLDMNPSKVLSDMKNKIRLFPDVVPTLKGLSKNYKLIIISNSAREMVDLKVEAEGIKKYFFKIYSIIDDFNGTKKSEDVFKLIIDDLKITSDDIIHVGDSEESDYNIPLKSGIKSLLLDRKGKEKGRHVIHNLTELKQKIKALEK